MCFYLIMNAINCLLQSAKIPFCFSCFAAIRKLFLVRFNITAFLIFNLLLCNCPTFKNNGIQSQNISQRSLSQQEISI